VSASSIRSQLQRKRDQRVDAEKRAAGYRRTESQKRASSAKAAASARTTRSASTAASKQREADRLERDANAAGAQVSAWSAKAAGYAKEEAALQTKLAKAELAEAKAADDKRRRETESAERRRKQEAAATERRLSRQSAEFAGRLQTAERSLAELREPRPEKLRVLMLAASADGELRLGREVKRIVAGIHAATNRDLVELDVRMAATPADLLDGLTQFRPHVVHFSGHAAENVVVFEEDVDIDPADIVVDGRTFVQALAAVDEPPALVLLNACNTADQAEHLASEVTHTAIGMSSTIPDSDAIAFAARFYAELVDGQSVGGAFELARVELELNGAADPDLPLLFERDEGLAHVLVLVLTPPV